MKHTAGSLTKRPHNTCRILVITATLVFLLTCTAYVHFDFAKSAGDFTEVLKAISQKSDVTSFSSNFDVKPVILLWTPYFSSRNYLPKLEDRCEVSCFITSTRDFLPSASAVVFHARDVSTSDIPSDGPSDHQVWVLHNNESPLHSPSNVFRALEAKINWTATYRIDSDIPSPYGRLVKRTTPAAEMPNIDNDKPVLVCWIVSNCKTDSQRETYVRQLKAFVPVRIYGKCGEERCPKGNSYSCYEHIAKECKFYLSFENSICLDYVTEKFFHALGTGMVPIVMGDANYSQLAPPNSYIDVFDYDSPKNLSKYLLKVNSSRELYMEYHTWKKHYEYKQDNYDWSCDLCKRLYNMQFYNENAHRNLSHWWFETANCQTWPKVLKLRS